MWSARPAASSRWAWHAGTCMGPTILAAFLDRWAAQVACTYHSCCLPPTRINAPWHHPPPATNLLPQGKGSFRSDIGAGTWVHAGYHLATTIATPAACEQATAGRAHEQLAAAAPLVLPSSPC